MLQRGGEVVIRMLANVQQVTIGPLIERTIAKGTLVYTDEYDIYSRLVEWGYGHETVCHAAGEYARDDDGDGFCEVHVNTLEGFWSLLRSWLRPHRGIPQESLPLYLGLARTFMTIWQTLRPCACPSDLVYRPPCREKAPVIGGRRWRAPAASWTRSWPPSRRWRIHAPTSTGGIRCPASWSSPSWRSSPAPPGPRPSPDGPDARRSSSWASSTSPMASPPRMSAAACWRSSTPTPSRPP